MLTSDGAGGATAESSLTFDGSTLDLVSGTQINGNSGNLRWRGGTTFYAGGADVLNTITAYEPDQGVTSVSDGSILESTWNALKYNVHVLTNQTNDGNAKNAGQLVALRDNGAWQIADADDATSTKLLGICLTNVDPNETMEVFLEGIIATNYHDQLASALPGLPLYVSLSAGGVTETAPTAAGDYVRLIGHNIYDNTDVVVIRFDPDNTWILL
jgi:hypothetical protein